MAAISFTQDITRQNSLDTTASLSSIGGGPGPSLLSALTYQGTQSAARRINSANTDYGFTVTEGTTRDTTTASFTNFMFKGFVKQRGDLNPAGIKLRLGSAGTAYHEWVMGDDGTILTPGFAYPASGGYILKPLNATLRAWLLATTGNPDETAIDEYSITANVANTAIGEDLSLDALDWFGDGFFMVGGTSPDTPGNFQDFVDNDEGEGSATVDRVSLFTSNFGVVFVYGFHTIGATSAGTATDTVFEDEFRTIVFPGGYLNAGTNGFELDIRNVNTSITWDNISVIGQGRVGNKILFDATATGVDTANDQITTTVPHSLITGEQILYSQENGTGTVVSLTGGESELVTGTTGAYYYVIRVSDTVFAVATSRANANAGTRAALTTATGTHSFTRTPDTRPDIIITSDATPGSFTANSCVFNTCRNITLADGATLNDTQIINSALITASDGVLSGVIINSPSTASFEWALTTATLDNFTDVIFIAGPRGGHAVRLTSIGTGTISWNVSTSGFDTGVTGSPITPTNTGNEDIFVDVTTASDLTINVGASGTVPSVRVSSGFTGNVNVVAATNVTIPGLQDNTEVRVMEAGSNTVEIAGIENATDGTIGDRSFTFSASAGTSVDIYIVNVLYENIEIEGYVIPSSDATLPQQQRFDRVYLNP